MGKRYYCDYCDKSFADNPQNRKKHITGVSHDRLRKLHYSQFKEPEDILAEETSKPPCRKLQQSGFCSFEGTCRFSHMTSEWHHELLGKIEAKQNAERAARDRTDREANPTVEDWLSKRAKRRQTHSHTGTHAQGGGASEAMSLVRELDFKLPAELQHMKDLPPSMIPPSANCFQEIAEWES